MSHGRSHACDQLLHPLIDGPERVLAENGALRLVVQLQVHPVDREVAPALLRPLDELAAQPSPGRLWWHGLRLEDGEIPGRALDRSPSLEQVVQPATSINIVVGEVDLRDP